MRSPPRATRLPANPGISIAQSRLLPDRLLCQKAADRKRKVPVRGRARRRRAAEVRRAGSEGLSSNQAVDLLVVGGGINGTGIARDAAGRGLKRGAVRAGRPRPPHLLGEQQADPRRAALSRAVRVPAGARGAARARGAAARRAAHHLAAALRPAARPAAAAGLADPARPDALRPSGRPPAAAAARTRSTCAAIRPAGRSSPSSRRGFAYADCWVDDARLVVLNALDASERGAEILTRTRCTARATRQRPVVCRARADGGGPPRQMRARALVNATGPWVSRFLGERLQLPAPERCAPGQGRPHRRAAALRPPRPLHPAERPTAGWSS